MKPELVVATRNKKKVEEIRRIMKDMSVRLYSLDDFPGCPEVEEDSDTFAGNAAKKAVAVAAYSKKPAIADDSGLEVYALKGAPGVLSARYAGPDADDRKNLEKLLSALRETETSGRGARFVCVIALAYPEGNLELFDGYAEGMIGTQEKGGNGFGYDPVFYPLGSDRTFAEMGDDMKDSLSHRGAALKKLREYLFAIFRGPNQD